MSNTTKALSTVRPSLSLRLAMILIPVTALAFGPLVACNAVKGAGKDLQESSDNTKDAVGRAVDK